MNFGEAWYAFLAGDGDIYRTGWYETELYVHNNGNSASMHNLDGTWSLWVPNILDLYAEDWAVRVVEGGGGESVQDKLVLRKEGSR